MDAALGDLVTPAALAVFAVDEKPSHPQARAWSMTLPSDVNCLTNPVFISSLVISIQ
jgi:hypothetical protein